jgi:hypothetical protein
MKSDAVHASLIKPNYLLNITRMSIGAHGNLSEIACDCLT